MSADAIRQLSDSRLKTDVRQIRDALGAVQQLRGVQFEWRHELFSRPGAMYAQAKRGLNLGFIAQEVQPVVPQVVSQNSDGFMEVDYSSIVPLLVESIKVVSTPTLLAVLCNVPHQTLLRSTTCRSSKS